MTRFMVTLTKDEAAPFMQICNDELRDPREQVHLWVRDELKRRGLLVELRSDAPSVLLSASAREGKL